MIEIKYKTQVDLLLHTIPSQLCLNQNNILGQAILTYSNMINGAKFETCFF